MFFNVNNLNEGKGGKNNFPNLKSIELKEGKNPKSNPDSFLGNWKQSEVHSHSNRNWERLRK